MRKPVHRIMEFSFWAVFAILASGVAVWAAGYKFVVVSPTATLPQGVTLVISPDDWMHFSTVDSVEAYCERCFLPTLWCKTSTYERLQSSGNKVFELPYSRTLFRLSRASIPVWEQIDDQAGGS